MRDAADVSSFRDSNSRTMSTEAERTTFAVKAGLAQVRYFMRAPDVSRSRTSSEASRTFDAVLGARRAF